MRLVTVDNLTPDMELAQPLYDNGKILLNTGVKQLTRYKKRLLQLGINYLYVNDNLSKNIEINDVIKNETRQKCRKTIRKVFDDVSFNKEININEVKEIINEMVEDILSNKNTNVNLIDIKAFDSYTFAHSVNVAVLSILLGNTLNYNKKRLTKLGIGAILHDIGKTLIPKNILLKKGKLTDKEFEIIKKHTTLGYKYLLDNVQISPISRAAILGHHERVDGSGYPKGLDENEIHNFAKIVAITDVFDALTSNRIYRKRWSTHKTINYLISNSNTKFHNYYIQKFIKNIAVYPNGTMVNLSNGYKAIIKEQNNNFPTRPVVIAVEDNNGKKISQTIDLMEELNIVIDDESRK